MSKYIAITLGPITRIISYAQSTKELWAASYFFSYLAKQIVTPFRQRDFLLPQLEDDMYDNQKTHGAGLFPDRYIFKAEEGDFDTLCNHCDTLYVQIGTEIANTIKKDKHTVTDYLKHSIKIYCFEKEFIDQVDIVYHCENLLGGMECQDKFPQKEETNYLALFFQKVNGSFLTKDAFAENKIRLFETIIEYSAIELNRINEWISLNNNGKKRIEKITSSIFLDEKIIPALEKKGILKPYHKYIAFVKADGDNMTATITGLKREGKSVSVLDKAILEYNLGIINTIEEYGGKAIFLGGDDLLFFAPVRNKQDNIFTLLEQINTAFNNSMKSLPFPPTLSFGVSISYYKHPMFEAIEQTDKLLKNAKTAGKNRIAWYLRKHSGQVSQGVINKDNKDIQNLHAQSTELIPEEHSLYIDLMKGPYRLSIELIQKGMINKNSSENLYNSYIFWLIENKEMLKHILSSLVPKSPKSLIETKKLLENYFSHSFNELIHENMKSYMNSLENYLISATMCYKDQEYAIDSLHAILRFVGFLKSE